MKVILLKDIKRFGNKGSVQEVADGYASSYLIPRGLAKRASVSEANHAQKIKESQAAKINHVQHEQAEVFKKFNHKKIVLQVQTNQSGKLFGAVSAADISSQLPGLDPCNLQIKKGIKELGEHRVPYQVGNMKGYITVVISR